MNGIQLTKLNGDGVEDGKKQGDTIIVKDDDQLVVNKNQLGNESSSSKKKRWRRINPIDTRLQSREDSNMMKRKFMEEECLIKCLEGGYKEEVKKAKRKSLEEDVENWSQEVSEIMEEKSF
ncbi:hypothetical protein GOBAR_AA20408 [Gossypium barbadense]|uniref:Uncharacterized protein n=1 Tax=Gossypium barbadense TaxID=3634 RepID=A0A2P5XA88_GOSBA|nr:hypothetical protein GOBAR_AA20408 [Gossypium barbadense]